MGVDDESGSEYFADDGDQEVINPFGDINDTPQVVISDQKQDFNEYEKYTKFVAFEERLFE